MNCVTLQGYIVTKRNGRVSTRITLKVIKDGIENYPIVSFSTISKKMEADKYKVGQAVRITAKIRPGTERGGSDKVVYFRQVLEGITITEARTEKEENNILEMASNKIDFVNRVEIKGEIVTLKSDRRVVSILICPEGEVNNIWVTCFTGSTEKTETLVQQLSSGDIIRVSGAVQTKTVGEREDRRRFENIIASVIKKCK